MTKLMALEILSMNNKRVLMIEGCDRTGKSTFIEMFCEKLKKQGKIPFVFHLMGPTKFSGLTFNNDEKSLIQLSKFEDEYALIEQMIESDERVIVILDRTAFGEYVWSNYWNRRGKYSNEWPEFGHEKLLEKTYYITFYLSNLETLANRIEQSEEDVKIFTQRNKSIRENIMYVYDLYDSLNLKIKSMFPMIDMEMYDNSNTLDDLLNYVNQLVKKF